MSWNWIPKETVMGIHSKSLMAFGGGEGVRDEGLLESALAPPENLSAYENPTVFDLAAAYAFGVIRNHPLVDGNKRTAFLTATLFLDLNGFALGADEAEATAITLAFASGEVDEKEYAAWLQSNCTKLS